MTLAKPIVPSTVLEFVGQQAPHILPSFSEVVALPIVSDWGPIGADPAGVSGLEGGLQEVTSFAEYTSLYGDSDTPGRTAAAGAFAGSGVRGATGAGGLLIYRMAGASKAKATATITSTATGTPPGLVLTGRYYGSRGNRIGYALDVDPSNAARDRLRITFNGAVVETYLYTADDVVTLCANINARSSLVRASNSEGTAAALTHGTGSLTGGNDGSVLTSAEHLAAQGALEFGDYSILAIYDLTDPAILASWVSWVQAQDLANRPSIFVCGGAAGETIDTALTRAAACADPHVVTVGVGTYHDDLLGKDLSTSQLAPRIAGVLAARGQARSLTNVKLAGLHVVGDTGAPSDAVVSAVQQGVVVLHQVSSPDADLAIAKGVTTYTGDTVDRPQDVFGDPRLIRIMDIYVRNMKRWGDDTVIGNVPVNQDARDAVRGEAKRLQDELLDQGLILPGNAAVTPPVVAPWVRVVDPGDPALADAIPYSFGWQFAKTANAIMGEGTVL